MTGMVYIPAGSPWDNGYIESINNLLRKAISHYHFHPDFLRPLGFISLRFVVVVSDMSPRTGWLHYPGRLTEAKKSRQQAHAEAQMQSILGPVACRGLPPTRVEANGYRSPEQVGSHSLHKSVALPANR
jgi:hypothetical protein